LEYIVYADESEESGAYFSNFYAGLLVRSLDLPEVLDRLKKAKEELHFGGRVKWQKVTPQYLSKYVALMEAFFNLVERDLVKVRVMFLHRVNVAVGLEEEQKQNTYYLLYYQFLKHAFGLQHSNDGRDISTSDPAPESEKRSLRVTLLAWRCGPSSGRPESSSPPTKSQKSP
jgi:hypothetical protein